MPEYLSPGVYVEEVDTGSKPIEGASTSTAGMVGVTERGPADWPMLVTSFGEYTRLFGEYLTNAIFTNSTNFLPHAVEGFFTNGGKRLYVTRALDELGATFAEFTLHDRGTATSTFTLLLRNAPENSGTLASGNPIYVVNVASLLPGNPLAANDHIRIGDGSAAEYHEVDQVAVAPPTHIILDQPLSRSHVFPGATTELLTRTPIDQRFTTAIVALGASVLPLDNVTGLASGLQLLVDTDINQETVTIQSIAGQNVTLTAPTTKAHISGVVVVPTLTVAAHRGDILVTLTGAAADIAAIVVGSLLEFSASVQINEYRLVRTATPVSAVIVRVTLDAPLTMEHPSASTTVTQLNPASVGTLAPLDRTANAGDRAVFTSAASPYNHRDLVIFDRTTPASVEVRRVGALAAFQISGQAAEPYPAGSLVEIVNMHDDQRSTTAIVASGSSVLPLNDVTGLASGLQLLVATGTNQETVTIQSITGLNVTLTAPTTKAHILGVVVVPMPKQLTAAAAAGSLTIAVNNRQTLSMNDVIRIGDPPNAEFGIIAALPNPSPVAPDDGVIVLNTPLINSHAGPPLTTPPANVRRQQTPVLNTLKPASVLEFDVARASTLTITSDGFTTYAIGDHLRITTSSGTYYHAINSAVNGLSPEPVTLLTNALATRHSAGSVLWQRDPLIDVEALDRGGWGNRLRISIEDETQGLVSRTTLIFNNPPTQIRLASTAGVESGTILELIDSTGKVVDPPLKVDFVDRTANYLINLAAPGLQPQHLAAIIASPNPLPVRSREFLVTIRLLHQPDPAHPQRNEVVIGSEIFRTLSMDPRHSRYIEKVIGDIHGPLRLADHRPDGESNYVRVHDRGKDVVGPGEPENTLHSIRLGPEALIDILPNGTTRPARHPLAFGDDSVATMTDTIYIGADAAQPENRTGLFTLQNIDDISIVACPGRTSALMQGALIDHCELMRYRFAVLDGPIPPLDSFNDVQFQRQQFDTKYAALYYPWILIPDPFPANPNNVPDVPIPPSGHIVGIYARTDIDRGVHKAPANEVVRGVLGLQRIINKGEQDILNPYPVNINVIRDFRPNNRGIRVWGGRVITSDSDFKYVNVRRLLIFIEKSIDQGLQWVVFEPNAEPLWARVIRSISNFLTVVWRNGALEGTKREEAFFVKCDRTTMTQADIDSGRLIVIIGVAPVKPAEFAIVRIGLYTAHSDE
jgi:phage tail sheath protein FI